MRTATAVTDWPNDLWQRLRRAPCERRSAIPYLGEKRRSVRENAPLQNRFTERIGKRRSGIECKNTLGLCFVRQRNELDKIFANGESHRTLHGQTFRERGAKNLAALHASLVFLRWRVLRSHPVTTLRHYHLRGSLKGSERTMIRNCEPRQTDDQNDQGAKRFFNHRRH
jgi:hypothetical protein